MAEKIVFKPIETKGARFENLGKEGVKKVEKTPRENFQELLDMEIDDADFHGALRDWQALSRGSVITRLA